MSEKKQGTASEDTLLGWLDFLDRQKSTYGRWVGRQAEAELRRSIKWPERMRKVLRQRIHIDAQDFKGQSALFLAVEYRSTEAIRILLDNAISPNIELERQDGLSPLSLATLEGYEEELKLLVNKYRNVDVGSAKQRACEILSENPDILTRLGDPAAIIEYPEIITQRWQLSPVIVVRLWRARDLKIGDILSQSSDPYCIVKLRDREGNVLASQRTEVECSTLRPEWRETFSRWDTDLAEVVNILIECWDKDKMVHDDFLGIAEIQLEDAREKTNDLISYVKRDLVVNYEKLMLKEKEPELLLSEKFELPLVESDFVDLCSRPDHDDKAQGQLQVGVTYYTNSEYEIAKQEIDERYLHSLLLVDDAAVSHYFHKITDILSLLNISADFSTECLRCDSEDAWYARGHSLLHKVLESGTPEEMEFLLKQKPTPNLSLKCNGETALEYAEELEKPEFIEILNRCHE